MMTPQKRKLVRRATGNLSPEETARADMMEQAAEEEFGVQVNFRWGREQINIIKEVAAKIGVPYQTYMKQVVYKQAIADAREMRAQAFLSGSIKFKNENATWKPSSQLRPDEIGASSLSITPAHTGAPVHVEYVGGSMIWSVSESKQSTDLSNYRKTDGSYHIPKSVVDRLLDHIHRLEES